jgi:hypothetical protein
MEKEPSWKTIANYFLDHDHTRVVPFDLDCDARLIIDPLASRMSFEIEYESEANSAWKNLKNIKFSRRNKYLQITCDHKTLFEVFYMVVLAIVRDIYRNKTNIETAIDESLKSFNLLLSKEKDKRDEVVGLWGEIHVLERLITHYGESAIEFWFGPNGDIHDFRVNSGTELEVKTTRRERREHIISNLTQLEASPSCDLFLYSVGICEMPSGESLLSKIARVRASIDNQDIKTVFQSMIEKHQWYNPDGDEENCKYAERYPCAIGLVDEKFPKITISLFNDDLGIEWPRIKDVRYTVNVEGLVAEEGTRRYKEIWSDVTYE